MDIRTVRTYKMLCDAFEELLSEKPFDEIGVTEICERSTVRRATFYRHFQDKYEFYGYYMTTVTSRLLDRIEQEGGRADDLNSYVRNMHRGLIRFMEENSEIARYNFGRGVPAGTLDMMVDQLADGIVKKVVELYERTGQTPGVPAEFLGLFYAAGLIHTLRWWFAEGKPMSADDLEAHSTEFLMRYFDGDRMQTAAPAPPSHNG